MDFKRAAIVSGKRAAGWARAMALEIHGALALHGVPIHLVDVDELLAFCGSAAGSDPATIFIDMNHRIVFPWRRPSVSVMVDHPCSLMKELAAPLSTDAITC